MEKTENISFLSYDVCKLLAEKNFPQIECGNYFEYVTEPGGWWNEDTSKKPDCLPGRLMDPFDLEVMSTGKTIAAITADCAKRWLRKNHKIHVEIHASEHWVEEKNEYQIRYTGEVFREVRDPKWITEDLCKTSFLRSYEEAEEEAIKLSLNYI